MVSKDKQEVDKINVEELLHEFKDINQEAFILYVKSVWKDLAQRSDNKEKGICKITFLQYYMLPGFISERMFAVFDADKDGYLSLQDFYDGMLTLFTKPFDELSYFIFSIYDADGDGKISREDIKSVMQYISIDKNMIKNAYSISSNLKFSDRVDSQKEIQEKLEEVFGKDKYLDYKKFKQIIEEKNSDTYIFLLVFLLENRPFKKKTIELYLGCLKNTSKSPSQAPSNKLIASPSLNSKFSPSQFLSNSPVMKHKKIKEKNGINLLSKYTDVGKKKEESVINLISGNKEEKNAPARKNMQFLKNLEGDSLKKKKDYDENDPKFNINEAKFESIMKISNTDQVKNDDVEEEEINQYEGFISKITESHKLKKLWFKLYDKDLFYYKEKDDTVHKGMHHLSGVYIKEESPATIDGITYYCFKMVYPQKDREYFVEDKKDYNEWVSRISKAIGFVDLSIKYEIGQKLGNGKFGLVKLAVNKQNGTKVAAKFMSKKEMTNTDLELARTEIEILKVCQHPNIIKIYDVFENNDSFYIFMEYCDGGDLFTRLEKTKFKIPEKKAANYIHQILAAIFYLHEYGITHRDLKPENILMSDKTDDAELKLIDFGLSKIIGPNETCTEPYGTLSYVAPEVLLEKPYNKQVDMWIVGIMAYLFCVGFLPFDHKDEREIAKMTMCDPTPFPQSYWSKVSTDAKLFVDACLQKNPNKRLTVKDALVHPWIKKFEDPNIIEKRKLSKTSNNQFEVFTNIHT